MVLTNSTISGHWHLSAPQRMYIDCQLLDRHLVEARIPGRHHAMAGPRNLCDDSALVCRVEGYGVRKARTAKFMLSFAHIAVASHAVLGKYGNTTGCRPGVKVLAG